MSTAKPASGNEHIKWKFIAANRRTDNPGAFRSLDRDRQEGLAATDRVPAPASDPVIQGNPQCGCQGAQD